MPCADAGLPVQEEILGTAEGHQQRSADRCNVFHGDDGQDILLFPAVPEQHNGQRNKDDERDVVCDKHGGEENAKDQKKGKRGHPLQVAGKADQRAKNVFLFETFQDAQHHQERAEGAPVDIAEQTRRRGRNDQRSQGCQQGQRQHHFLFQKRINPFHHDGLPFLGFRFEKTPAARARVLIISSACQPFNRKR